MKVKVGDRVGEGSVIMTLEAAGAAATPPKEKVTQDAKSQPEGPPASYGSPAGVYDTVDVRVPDIGDFKSVPVIEIHVEPGEAVKAEDPLLTLESDKATMDVPAPAAGTVAGLLVKIGDRVSEGDLDPLICAPDSGAAGRIRRRSRCRRQLRRRGPRAPPAAMSMPKCSCSGRGRADNRRVPRGRSRQAGGARRALADARRRVPECRLHPIESVAARRQGDRGDA